MKTKQQKRKQEKLRLGAVVENKKLNKSGLVVKKGFTDGYYHVMSSGKLLEWHMSNIIILLDGVKEDN